MGIAQGYDIDKLELKQGHEIANIATKHANALTLQKTNKLLINHSLRHKSNHLSS